MLRALSGTVSSRRVSCHAPFEPYRGASPGLIVAFHSAVLQPNCAVSWPLFWPYRGRTCLAMRSSQPCLSRYNALHRDSTPEWAVVHFRFHCTFFFFSHHFFFLIPATGKPPKKIFIYFFHFPIELNKFIKIYFILFFSSFTHCKTSKKKFFS